MKSKWFVVILPALMVALFLIPLTVPGFASEELVSVSEGSVIPADGATDETSVGEDSAGNAEVEVDSTTDCQKGIHKYRDGYGACTICEATPTPAPTPGDMDGNGVVGATDVVSLVRFFLEDDDSIQARPDVDGDGELTLSDIIHYLRYLMGDGTIVSDPEVSPAYWREATIAD